MASSALRASCAAVGGALIALVLLGFSGRCALAEEAVLVTSTVAGYTPGRVISDDEKLTLPDGASVTLLFRSGQILRLRGPFQGPLQRAQPANANTDISALVQLFRLRGVDASVVGGTREWRPAAATFGVASLSTSGGSVLINPQHAATYCVTPSDDVRIARPADDGEAYGLRRRGRLEAIAWPVGADRTEWPVDVPIEDRDRVEIVAGGKPRVSVSFRVMDAKYPSRAAWIAAGMLAGCHEQFDAELRQLGQATVPPELWLTSNRGRRPTYRSGEAIGLTVEASTDGYLYCVERQVDQSVVLIVPAGAQLRGAVPASLPGGRRGDGLRAGPSGTARIACWLADRDISSKLPQALLDPAERRLPDQLAQNLDGIFSDVNGRQMPKAELTIRVE